LVSFSFSAELSVIVLGFERSDVKTNLFRQHEEEVDDVFRFSLELFPEFRILSRDADRASVQVALAHHRAEKEWQQLLQM
jgi:hypothetical protein